MRFLNALFRLTGPARYGIAQALCPRSFWYAADGEDKLVTAWLLSRVSNFSDVRYLDIGAGPPVRLSNTYALYQRGARGVLVEPDPRHIAQLERKRPRDTVVKAGAAFDGRRSAVLVSMTNGVFSTFFDDHAERIVAASDAWEQKQQVISRSVVPLIPINEIIDQHLESRAPDFLSIDAEGADFEILATLDFSKFRPTLICAEESKPLAAFNELLSPHGYSCVCHTPGNVMFLLT